MSRKPKDKHLIPKYTRPNYVWKPKRKIDSPEQLQQLVYEYFLKCDNDKQPYTISGLCLFVGILKTELNRLEARPDVGHVARMARLCIENYTEYKLLNDKNPAGAIFSLKNNFNWTDKREVRAEVGIGPIIRKHYTEQEKDKAAEDGGQIEQIEDQETVIMRNTYDNVFENGGH